MRLTGIERHGVVSQGTSTGLMSTDDDENVTVDDNHEKERSEEKTGVLATEPQLVDEIRLASV